MIIATWNLNNRVGKVRFRPEAAQAAITVEADLIVFTEFYPQQNEEQFRYTLEQAGWQHQIISNASTEIANRILIASRIPLLPLDIEFPDFDQQFPSNLLGVTLPSVGLTVLGVLVPAYHGNTAPLLFQAWQWLEATAASLKIKPTLILGDLNVAITSNGGRAADYFRRILANGWYRATPSDSPTFFSHTGSSGDSVFNSKRRFPSPPLPSVRHKRAENRNVSPFIKRDASDGPLQLEFDFFLPVFPFMLDRKGSRRRYGQAFPADLDAEGFALFEAVGQPAQLFNELSGGVSFLDVLVC